MNIKQIASNNFSNAMHDFECDVCRNRRHEGKLYVKEKIKANKLIGANSIHDLVAINKSIKRYNRKINKKIDRFWEGSAYNLDITQQDYTSYIKVSNVLDYLELHLTAHINSKIITTSLHKYVKCNDGYYIRVAGLDFGNATKMSHMVLKIRQGIKANKQQEVI